MQLDQLTQKACEIVWQVGAYIRAESERIQNIEIIEKDINSLVSYVDRTAEEQLAAALQRLTPGCGFLTEEDTIRIENKPTEWIIDPLDGTTNFLYGIPAYCISIGLQVEEKLRIGIVYEICRQEMFYGYDGGGTYLNKRPVRVSNRQELRHSLLATGFPFTDFSGIDDYISVLKQLMRGTRGLRRMGSAALDLAYVACGRFDGFFEYSLNAWDVAAGAVLIAEAGGKVTDFAGGNNFLFGKEIIATNGRIHDQLQHIIQMHFFRRSATC